jgi:hypothetical protein
LVFYVLPVFIPLALVTARGLTMDESGEDRDADRIPVRRTWIPALAAWVALLLAGRLALAHWPLDRDARALYRALPPVGDAEIVVDDHRAHHGLSYYADRDIEYVYLPGAKPNAKLVALSIEDELSEESGADHHHIYVIEAEHAAHLEERRRAAHARIVWVKRVRGFEVVFTMPPPA